MPRSDQLVTIRVARPEESGFYGGVSYPNYLDLRDGTRTLDGLLAYQPQRVSIARAPDASRDIRTGLLVSENFFDVLDVRPALGRSFRPDEGLAPGRDAVVVLGHDVWQSDFGADPSVIDRPLWINDIAFTVVGVAPASFTGVEPTIRPAGTVKLRKIQLTDPPRYCARVLS